MFHHYSWISLPRVCFDAVPSRPAHPLVRQAVAVAAGSTAVARTILFLSDGHTNAAASEFQDHQQSEAVAAAAKDAGRGVECGRGGGGVQKTKLRGQAARALPLRKTKQIPSVTGCNVFCIIVCVPFSLCSRFLSHTHSLSHTNHTQSTHKERTKHTQSTHKARTKHTQSTHKAHTKQTHYLSPSLSLSLSLSPPPPPPLRCAGCGRWPWARYQQDSPSSAESILRNNGPD